MSGDDFDPLTGRGERDTDLRIEFRVAGVQYGRWIGAMQRDEALRFVMFACNITPNRRRELTHLVIRSRQEHRKWNPKNQKPVW